MPHISFLGAALDQASALGFSLLLPPICSLPAFIHLGRELHCANNSSSVCLCNVWCSMGYSLLH